METAAHSLWMWLSGISPERWLGGLATVGGFFWTFVRPVLMAKRDRWLKAQERELELMDDRDKERGRAAEAFPAQARAVLDEANRALADELRAAQEDTQRALRGQMEAENRASAVEELARAMVADK